MFDLLLRNLRIAGANRPRDIGIASGQIAAIGAGLDHDGLQEDFAGRFAFPGFVESHIHLDKACILDRCPVCQGTLAEAVALTAQAKPSFTAEDVYARGKRVLEKAICQGTVAMRTFVEVDPRSGMRSLEAIVQLRHDFAHRIDLQICAFAQEGLTQEMQTFDMLDAALKAGADLIGGCPYTDPDPKRHIELIFDLAARHGTAADFHIDFDLSPKGSNIGHVVAETLRRGYQGRVSIGHATTLSAMPPDAVQAFAARLAEAGIALTVLPATDLFINGRGASHLVPRGVAPAHAMACVAATIGTNNVLNPFTPYGDASLLRMANLYANIAQLASDAELEQVFAMIAATPARLMGVGHSLEVGAPATIVVIDASHPVAALREISSPLAGWFRGHANFVRPKARLL